MNEKLQQYLNNKKQQEEEKYLQDKSDYLIERGLYDKVFAPDPKNVDKNEYNKFGLNPDTNNYEYYKEVPVSITDEEFVMLMEADKDTPAIDIVPNENNIRTVVFVVAIIIYIAAFILGIVYGNEFKRIETSGIYNIKEEFNIGLMFGVWFSGAIVGTLMLGISEIIKLLYNILNKK